jgi:hypothetical protein
MPVRFDESDYNLLNQFAEAVLTRHAGGTYSLESARMKFVEAFALIAESDTSFRDYMWSVLSGSEK